MPRKPRVVMGDSFYHVFDRGVEKRKIYLDDADRLNFLFYLKECSKEFEVSVVFYCLMENHYHLLVKTKLENLDKFMQRFHLKYVKYFNYKYLRVGSLFQGRYQSRLVLNDAYIITLADYIHKNPLELGRNIDCMTYRWSSYKSYLGLDDSDKEWLATEYWYLAPSLVPSI